MRLLLLFALAACNSKDPETVPSAAVLEEGGVVTCADPSARDELGAFERKNAPEQKLGAAYLAGGGLAIEDFDGDGHLDLFIPSEETVQLWWGDGTGTFEEDATVFTGIDLTMAAAATAVDVDADADLDLFVARWEKPATLVRNDGDRRFSDITAEAGLGAYSVRSQSSSWGDIDRDGDLDLFVGSYGQWTVVNVGTPEPECEDHLPDPSQLWRNEGDGTFSDISDLLPPEVHAGYVFASGFYDLDDDGFPELFVANDDGRCAPSVLVDNHGGTAFTIDAGSAFHADSHDMGMAVGDLNGDELPDLVLTSWKAIAYLESRPSPLGANGVLWIDAADQRGMTLGSEQVYGWGAEFGDVDNDADLDLVAGFGYWSTYDGAGDPLDQDDSLLIQDSAGTFSNQAGAFGVDDRSITRAVVWADLDEDGWPDLVKRALDGPTPMYLSRCGAESWIEVRLADDGPNTRGIGAKVRVTVGGESQVRWVHSGSSGLYSGSPLAAHFGLGGASTVDAIDVFWPDGEVDSFSGVAANQPVVVRRSR